MNRDPLSLSLSSLTLSASAGQVLEFDYHPDRPLLATADVTGIVQFYALRKPRVKRRSSGMLSSASSVSKNSSAVPTGGQPETIATLSYHTDSCRTIAFHSNGAYAYTGSADRSIGIIDCATLTLSSHIKGAHDAGVNRIAMYDDNLFVSGDDDGYVNVWDLRANNMAHSIASNAASSSSRASSSSSHGSTLHPLLHYRDAGDYISDICSVPSKSRLLITSGDGHMYVYDMRVGHIHERVSGHGKRNTLAAKAKAKAKNQSATGDRMPSGATVDTWFAMSNDVDDELSGVVVLKGGKKVVCAGREEGILNVFKWDYFGVAQDHFNVSASNELEGSGASIDSMIKVDEDTVITGSTDGLIRLIQLHPNKLIGIIGTHEEFPIECIKMSPPVKEYFDTAKGDDDEDDAVESSSSSSAHVRTAIDDDDDAADEESTSSNLLTRFLASSSHDQTIKFWNCSELFEVDEDEVKEEEDDSDDDGEDGEDDDGEDEDDDEEEAKAPSTASKKASSASSSSSSLKKAIDLKRKRPADVASTKVVTSKKKKVAADADDNDVDQDDDDDDDQDGGDDDDLGAAMSDLSDAPSGDDDDGDASDMDDDDDASGSDGDEEAAAAEADIAIESVVAKSSSKSSRRPMPNAHASFFDTTTKPSTDASSSSSSSSSALPLFAFSTAAIASTPTLKASKFAPKSSSSKLVATASAPAAIVAPSAPLAPILPPSSNKWLKVAASAESILAAADLAEEAAFLASNPEVQDGPSSRPGGGLNAATGFFHHLPITHPMHPSQQHKRTRALKVAVDNIALRPEKKREALKEKLRKSKIKRDRMELKRQEATEKGEDPDLVEESEDDEEEERKGGGGKPGGKSAKKGGSDDDDDDDDDSDDDGADGEAKPVKERKLTSKERKAQKKLDKKKNPFFSGL